MGVGQKSDSPRTSFYCPTPHHRTREDQFGTEYARSLQYYQRLRNWLWGVYRRTIYNRRYRTVIGDWCPWRKKSYSVVDLAPLTAKIILNPLMAQYDPCRRIAVHLFVAHAIAMAAFFEEMCFHLDPSFI